MALISGQMVDVTLASGKIIICMDLESTGGRMGADTRVSI
jgi:hypothetical protein